LRLQGKSSVSRWDGQLGSRGPGQDWISGQKRAVGELVLLQFAADFGRGVELLKIADSQQGLS